MSNLRYFTFPLGFTLLGLLLGAYLGYGEGHTMAAALSGAFICGVLGILEVSLSLDNAIVNAKILKDMDPTWQKRFLTWGILIAVFGMRIIFPLAIVAIAAHIGPIETIRLAIENPDEYARVLSGAHVSISAFGGSFLLMVAFKYFFDADKAVHWIAVVESRLTRLGSLEGIELALVLILMLAVSYILPHEEAFTFMRAAVYGLIAFIAVEGVGHFLEADEDQMNTARRTGAGAFIYLEVLDASFSFDGVIGAFALSKDIFIIAIGLGIGAAYVRAMTLLLVDKGTLAEYRFLEHGAFYAILTLALIMYAQTFTHVPEVVTGLIGAALIGLALISSVIWTRNHPEAIEDAEARDPAGEGAVSKAAVVGTVGR